MNKMKSALVAVLILGACGIAGADFSFGVGTNNFYLSVGNYDYYPYGVPQGYTPRINFYDVMSDYGYWVYVPAFGRVWHPYADNRWRPYLYGHWIYTQYGPTWQGYEPWAWVGYHYGNWALTPQYGWVWIPGYDWNPGQVTWSYGAGEVGWMPTPPSGYDYCRGYLHRHDDYGYRYNDGYGPYGGYYSEGAYAPAAVNVNVNLWVFINSNHYDSDNYADSYLDGARTRELFEQRAVRISNQPIERTQMERMIGKRINQVAVETREVQTERKSVKMVIPQGEEEHIRKNANRVVQDVIRPGFEKEHRNFKGNQQTDEKAVERIFKNGGSDARNTRTADDSKFLRVQRPEEKRSFETPENRNDQFRNDRSQKSADFDNRYRSNNEFRQGASNVPPARQKEADTDNRYRMLGPPVRKDADQPAREFDVRSRDKAVDPGTREREFNGSQDRSPVREQWTPRDVEPNKGGNQRIELRETDRRQDVPDVRGNDRSSDDRAVLRNGDAPAEGRKHAEDNGSGKEGKSNKAGKRARDDQKPDRDQRN